jgi:hypothetical protein
VDLNQEIRKGHKGLEIKKNGGVLKALKYDNPGIFKDSELI